MPLQNRVTPRGDIVTTSARGTMFGNRGGRIHTSDRTLTSRRWASRAWICCVLEFKNRQRQLMAPNSYTELFSLDEVTALAAGHRPCFECRRADALAFFECHRQAFGLEERLKADELDCILHDQRLSEKHQHTYQSEASKLLAGTVIEFEEDIFAVSENSLLKWSFDGYTLALPKPQSGNVKVLTPPVVAEILRVGYKPRFHPSASDLIGVH